jgi:hypothetical protein
MLCSNRDQVVRPAALCRCEPGKVVASLLYPISLAVRRGACLCTTEGEAIQATRDRHLNRVIREAVISAWRSLMAPYGVGFSRNPCPSAECCSASDQVAGSTSWGGVRF